MSSRNIIKKDRINIIIGGFFIVALLIVVKLYQVQIVNGEEYSNRADRQYYNGVEDSFDRGSIFFTDKNGEKIAAATVKTGYKLTVDPSKLKNPEDIFNNLSGYVEIDEERFLNRAFRKGDTYEEIAKRVPQEIADKLIEKEIPGVAFRKEKWRFYPGKNLASQSIGFMSFSGDKLVAQYGLERQYDDMLEMRDKNIFKNFFVELFSEIGETVVKNKKPRGSIVTTIEPSVQSFIEEKIDEVSNTYSSKMTGAIIMNPKNGEIYALALDPSFDLNEFSKVEDSAIYKNHLVESIYEMGSIVKPLTMAIGIDAGVVHENTTYDDKGHMTLNNATFYNYDLKARGVVPMQEVLNQSLNTGVAFVVGKTGNDRFATYMKKLLSGTTGIDLPNEVSPLLTNLEHGIDIEYATASFGQGIAMSPIAITRALAALGNGGKLVTPHLVKEFDYEVGLVDKNNVAEPIQVFKKETSEEITRMLVKVVDTALKGGTVYLPNYSIAAKTGTAQIPNPETHRYYDDRYLHSFFGYFPAYDPEFIVFLYTVEPKNVKYASETLTDPFMDIVKFLINYYEIPPDREAKLDENKTQ